MENVTYKFDTCMDRGRFIRETTSGIYSGTNEDDEEVIIFLQQNEGAEVWTKHHAKPMWYEVVYYDAYGIPEGVTYTPTAELDRKMEQRSKEVC